ncbi:2-C-methyl-D-erythritol 4-phosphate cytidylyltransferase [Breznakia sp. PF5-3]|uniref:2-C-methyl-D-erythritol 4-phosphate cytidylyltransferase n=1 Tax=unclassified Breznakia TaxID=2623764 RepID=UPI002404E240|nr:MULTISPECIES: 2-C-methyl-D-erythritol 4-phosphate cytidylyltransferase [unclassified Breznakia]MDL2276916.1 2-C-methyl-D-erythritol 4-phosphate cytidylyltransferase [Breznakia sp. OttesenSCG-928-G09]MDF9824778.1 2-C-methyl-D-erythritol 4-phosphate cytidylyltransferase [Breznakia sp. PM6-1]MDF9835766.1 2-C-methyl-D-erythritol 4-phosphate cytidylyltransferase [Breznakia sp. PF5-3]MDF9837852.1 2-C-methyl-D-erythritol 4-phosphate cytidylyltransferase [Breznakia sp. PFB2-8]MDF9859777.1 2-C-methy
MKYTTIIVAAGKGTRTNLGYNKLFYEKHGEPLITKTLSPFIQDPDCIEIIMVVSLDDKSTFERIIHSDKVIYAIGGQTRQESVYNGLKVVQSEYVMIHDGARPFLKKEQITALKQTLQEDDACLLVVPVVDTIKIVEDGYVKESPLRSQCYSAQTPQCFKTGLILECHKKGQNEGFFASDDAQLFERYGKTRVKAVVGDYGNKKITTKEDL